MILLSEMIVHPPSVTRRPGETTAEAAVELDRRGGEFPATLWFTFPDAVGEFVTDRADGFAAALLPLAMSLREPLTVRGELSYRFARGLRDYLRYQSTWKPAIFGAVELRCERLRGRDPGEGTGAVGTAFSGGVDSFHTLWTHLDQNEDYPPYRLTHCLMINGFDPDTDLADAGNFAAIQRLYDAMAARLGLRLIVVRTNLLQFVGLAIQKQSFASFVTAPALVLGRLFSRYYVPSSYQFTQLATIIDGSHPMLDPLLGTETLEIVHDGGHLTRVAKTLAISRFPDTHDLLRVCFRPTGVQKQRDAIANCCTCEKCVRTMVTLDIAGALGDYRCFAQPLRPRTIRGADYSHPGSRPFAREVIEYAKQERRDDVVRNLRNAVVRSILYRARVRELVGASYRLEQRSKPYAAIVRPAKRLLQRIGLGRGWLY